MEQSTIIAFPRHKLEEILSPGAAKVAAVLGRRGAPAPVAEGGAMAEDAVQAQPDSAEAAALLDALLEDLLRVLDCRFWELSILTGMENDIEPKMLLSGVMNRIYDSFRQALPYDRIGLAFVEKEQTVVRAIWGRSQADEMLLREGYSAKLDGSSLGTVMRNGWPRIIYDLRSYLDAHPSSGSSKIIAAEGMRSSLTVPLNALDQPVGFLFFSSMQANAYSEEHVELVVHIARRLSILLEKARLYHQLLEFEAKVRKGFPELGGAFRQDPGRPRAQTAFRSVICADADLILRLIYEDVLSNEGYHVRVCADGAEVMAEFARSPADLLILSSSLPRINGFELCTRLRQGHREQELPIVLVLPDVSNDGPRFSMECGATDVMFKPLRPDELLGKISLLAGKAGSRHDGESSGLEFGNLFAEKYRIVQPLAHGGFSTIYFAQQVTGEVEGPVALKVVNLPPAQAADKRYLSRLLREAYEHSRLDHPNIVRLQDFGQVASYYYLAMEYVDGLSLAETIDETGPLPEESLIFIGHELAKALRYIDENDLVHRDVKCSNVMLTRDGDVKLLDFGLARRQQDPTISLEDEFHGTPQYAAPEYILGERDADIRADVYSLGVVLYYAACGVYPFSGQSAIDVLRHQVHDELRPLWWEKTDVSEDLSVLINQMLSKNREQRPNPKEVLNALARLMRRPLHAAAEAAGEAKAKQVKAIQVKAVEQASGMATGSSDEPAPAVSATAVPEAAGGLPPTVARRLGRTPAVAEATDETQLVPRIGKAMRVPAEPPPAAEPAETDASGADEVPDEAVAEEAAEQSSSDEATVRLRSGAVGQDQYLAARRFERRIGQS